LTGHMHDGALCTLLDNGGLLNCSVTSKDLRLARKLFGPCPGCCVQGKTTEVPAVPTNEEPALRCTKLHSDIFFVHDGTLKKNAPYLIVIESATNFMMVTKLYRGPDRTYKFGDGNKLKYAEEYV
jgi:hypothetical protein